MSHWVKAREFATQFEAELARARLQSAGIPATIKSHAAGIFGAGYQGAVPSGVQIHVPSNRLAAATELLDARDTTQR
ncbi:MAG TPA: DUF2007 domain-containing protein [Gemmatimonadaceae bacterium]|nr:DUF2007 domain-containing protein [Gemmatimonadaceae bacterium]